MTFKAVRIIHNIITRIDFSFLAEFFRLAGIYVVECIDGDEDESPYQKTENCYDITINTCESDGVLESELVLDFCNIKAGISNVSNIRQWNKAQQIRALNDTLGQMALLLDKSLPGDVWKVLVREYVANDLVLHSLNLQYYLKKASFAVEDAQNAFYEVQHALKSSLEILDENDPERKHLEYGQIYCKTKINAGCKFMKQGFEFPIEELADECTECINKYPDFSNLKVLLGLCYEHAPVYAPMAIRALAYALEEENAYCYASHIYYWIGKQYEAYQANWRDAVDSYNASYRRKHKYKNMYKLAIARRTDGDYKIAIESFKGIINKLAEKIKLGMLDPLEIEYYFKSKAMVSIIYFNDLKDYLGAIEHGEYLIRKYNQLVDMDDYYDQFYGKEAENYRRLTKQRFDIKRIRSILYYSYHYLGLEEKAIKYMNMEDDEE